MDSPTVNPPTPPTSANANITRTITIDPQSREVIYRVIDARTRQVLWQLPDAALLRNKAYGQTLISWEFPRLCRGGSRSLTYAAVGHPGNLRWLAHENACGAARQSIKLRRSTGMANTVRCFLSRSLGLDILARRCHHGNCSAFSVIGTGALSSASPSRFERLTH